MPTYDYECMPCNLRLEARHSINTQAPNCPQCDGTLTRLILSAPAAHGRKDANRQYAHSSRSRGEASISMGQDAGAVTSQIPKR